MSPLLPAVIALVLVGAPTLWRRSRHLVTIVHEGGHAVAAVLTGRRLHGIRLHGDSSGLTVSSGRAGGAGTVVTLAAGYPAPALFGLAAAALVAAGQHVALLWGVLGLLALLVVQVRNWFGLLPVLVAAAVVGATLRWGGAEAGQTVAASLAWFLLLAAPRAVAELHRTRRRGGQSHSDADQLASLTRVPAFAWVAMFWVGSLATLVAGARILL